MARFTLATGLRERNVVKLQWSQVDLSRERAWIHPDQAKARKAIAVPLNEEAVAVLLRQIDKGKLAIALKGASEPVRNLFFSNMSERASKILREDMQALGPVRLRDVDSAQSDMVMTAKDLADKGEIMIVDQKNDDELVY